MSRAGLPDGEDIDAFLKKVEDVERQLKGLQDGSLAPQDVAVPGAWTFDAADGELLLTLAKAHRAVTWESAFRGHGALGDAGREDVHRQMLLERFGAENPGFDFSQAQVNGRVPDPRVFSGWARGREGEGERGRGD